MIHIIMYMAWFVICSSYKIMMRRFGVFILSLVCLKVYLLLKYVFCNNCFMHVLNVI
jgi:hypothetical protein